jgi:hypothetical protein
MYTQKQGDFWILCGKIIPKEMVKVGQSWISTRSTAPVKIVRVSAGSDWVSFAGDVQPECTKDNYNFQGKYSLILDSDQVPAEYQNLQE